MKALVKKEARQGLWLEDVPEPKLGINDVLIKMKRTAICGRDATAAAAVATRFGWQSVETDWHHVIQRPDIDLIDEKNGQLRIKVNGVDVFKPQSGEVVSSNTDGIACWFIDTDYNEESFFVRHAYFLGANDPYKALKTTLKAEIDRLALDVALEIDGGVKIDNAQRAVDAGATVLIADAQRWERARRLNRQIDVHPLPVG